MGCEYTQCFPFFFFSKTHLLIWPYYHPELSGTWATSNKLFPVAGRGSLAGTILFLDSQTICCVYIGIIMLSPIHPRLTLCRKYNSIPPKSNKFYTYLSRIQGPSFEILCKLSVSNLSKKHSWKHVAYLYPENTWILYLSQL